MRVATLGLVLVSAFALPVTAQSPAAPFLDGRVSALAIGHDGRVYVGGSVLRGDTTVAHVARWGTAWGALGAGVGGAGVTSVYALAVGPDGSLLGLGLGGASRSVSARALAPDSSLYVGGSLRTAGGQPATNVARWDGQAWSSLGEATVAVASEAEPTGTSALRVAVAPNPSRGAATLTGASGEATTGVLNALGRRVARFALADGRREVALPAGLVPGVYVVRVASGGKVAARLFVVVR